MPQRRIERKPTAETVPVSSARLRWAELINRAQYAGEHFLLTRYGKPIAALVPPPEQEAA